MRSGEPGAGLQSGGPSSCRAHAKVNLRLRVFQRDEEGYHGLETIFLRCALHDDVEISEGPAGIHLKVEGPEDVSDGARNLCWQAAERFFETLGEAPAISIRLFKRIPVAAGLGGGSADAAAVLRTLAARHRGALSESALLRLAGSLGSDVPFPLLGVAMALAWERGRRLMPLRPPPSRPGLILVPPFRVATSEAFAWLDGGRRAGGWDEGSAIGASGYLPGPGRLHDWGVLARVAHNDFEAILFDRYPVLRELRDALRAAGAEIALVSGSGPVLYAVFADPARRDAAAGTGLAREGWRLLPTDLPPDPRDS